jgi:SPP1 family predicted phage head-tail adaptor
MPAGAMKKRLKLDQFSEDPGAYGDAFAGTYATLATVWGSVQPLRGRELAQFQQVHADVSHRIRIRYSNTVSVLTPKDRVVLGSRNFDIQSVINIRERNWELELICKENIGA